MCICDSLRGPSCSLVFMLLEDVWSSVRLQSPRVLNRRTCRISMRILHDEIVKRVYLILGTGLSTLYYLVHLIYRTTLCNGGKARLSEFSRDK